MVLEKEVNENMSSLMDKLKKNSRLKDQSNILTKSDVFKPADPINTGVPMLNTALTGSLKGGLIPGLTVLAGPSKHFKTMFSLLLASAYLKKHEDAVLLFYDSELGSPESYFRQHGIDPERVYHTVIKNVEEFKFDIVNQLENFEKGDHVVIVVDSLGNLASKKEVEDAKDEKSVADMSRAKAMKSLFRIVTPYLKTLEIPMLCINHTYDSMGLFPSKVVSGGTGIMYSADTVWIIGRRQKKDAEGIKGYDFVINVEKSRYVKEKSLVPISVTWEGGVQKMSGLLDVAMAGDFIFKPSKGWYQRMNPETGEALGDKFREKETQTEEFWTEFLEDPRFNTFVERMFQIGQEPITEVELVSMDEIE